MQVTHRFTIKKGTTSRRLQVHIGDSSVTTGAGLTGLAFGTASLTAYYYRDGAGSAVAITLVTATLGTWVSGGFIVVDGTNMPGVYELDIPDLALATASNRCTVVLKGAANMRPCVIEIDLVDYDPFDGVRLGLTALPNAAAAASGGLLINGSNTGTVTLAALTVTGATTLTGNVSMAAGLSITQSSSNASALVVTGNGTGHGAIFTSGSGATGNGVQIVSAATNGNGLNVAGVGTGTGLKATGGATGVGLQAIGGATSGDGAQFTATTDGDGLQLTAAGASVFGLRCADLLDSVVTEVGINARQALAIIGSVLAGDTSGFPGGPAVFKGMDNATTRVQATVDADGNRSATALSPPA